MVTRLPEVDAVVVGLGWTGGIMSAELARAGLKVVALERGAPRDTDKDYAVPTIRDELRYVVRHDLMQNTARDTLTVRNNPTQEALPMRRLGSFLPGEVVGGSGVLSIAWDKVSVPVTIETDVVATLVPKIQAAMAADGKKPYYQAAWFYYENDLDPKLAAAWMAEAVKERPDTVWLVHRQALVLAKAGDKAGALAAAKQSLALAEKAGGAQGAEYKRLNEELIAKLK